MRQFPECRAYGGWFENQFIIDADLKKDGLANVAKAEAKLGTLPKTRTNKSGSGGRHFIARLPFGSGKFSKTKLEEYGDLEIIGSGGYILLPGSLHESGNYYENLDPSPIAEAPAAWIALALEQQTRCGKGKGKPITPLKDGSRHNDLISYIGRFRSKSFANNEILTMALALDATSDNLLGEVDVTKMVLEYAHQEKPAEGTEDSATRELHHGVFDRVFVGVFDVAIDMVIDVVNTNEGGIHYGKDDT